MSAYTIGLFVHFVGLIFLFGASLMMNRVGARIRRASTVEELRLWLGFGRSVQPFFPVGSILLLLSGAHLAGLMSWFSQPFVVVGLVTVFALMSIGPFVQRPRFMAMGKAAGSAPAGPVPPDVAAITTDPAPWRILSMSTGAATGLVWIMTAKPGWLGSIASVIGFAIVGAVLGSVFATRDRARVLAAAIAAAGAAAQAEVAASSADEVAANVRGAESTRPE